MPSPKYSLPATAHAQASIIREQDPSAGEIDHGPDDPTLTQWGFTPDKTVLAIQRVATNEKGLPTVSETATISFTAEGDIKKYTGQSVTDPPPPPKKSIGPYSLVRREDIDRQRAASQATAARLIETVFKSLD